MAAVSLDDLFPGTGEHVQSKKILTGIATDASIRNKDGRPASTSDDPVKTRWATVCTLEMRGLSHREIADALHISQTQVSVITHDDRYLTYREERLAKLDSEFVAMKPLAFAALRNGLSSADENTALRASEQWFKGAGFGGFSKEPQPSNTLTAEDVARALITAVQVNVTVNTDGGPGPSTTLEERGAD